MWSHTPGGLDTRSCGLPSTVNRVTSTLNLHALLSEWEFKEKSIRVPSAETPRKGWEVTEAELIELHQIPGVTRIGRRLLIHERSLLQWLDQQGADAVAT